MRKEKNNNEYQTLILAALLHDIGKFWERGRQKDKDKKPTENLFQELLEKSRNQKLKHYHAWWSAQFIKEYEYLFSDSQQVLDSSLYHSNPRQGEEYINDWFVMFGDWLSSMERREIESPKDYEEPKERFEIPLEAVFNHIDLGKGRVGNKQSYNLNILQLQQQTLFPQPIDILPFDLYHTFRENMKTELNNLKNTRITIETLYYLLYKYTWCIPSATNKEEGTDKRICPDISLFDHLKTTSAIAICLAKIPNLYKKTYYQTLQGALIEAYRIKKGKLSTFTSETYRKIVEEDRFFYLLRGDISGIQHFIYSVAQPKTAPGISKRLRGRSFYISLMCEVFARYLLRKLELPITNLLYCGGGRFDLLLPYNPELIEATLNNAISQIEDYCLRCFYGELGLVVEKIPLTCIELDNYNEALKNIEDKIQDAKKNKYLSTLKQNIASFIKPDDIYKKNIPDGVELCHSCHKIPIPSNMDKICSLCKKHQEMGEILPKIDGIIFATNQISLNTNIKRSVVINFDKFGLVYLVKLKDKNSQIDIELPDDVNLSFFAVNTTDNFYRNVDISKPNISAGFKFLPTTIPLAKDKFLPHKRQEPYKKGEVVDFETIAEMSTGDKRLGILKADIDLLGLIFSNGLGEDRTISRISTLSRMLDIFFCGYINNICKEQYQKWVPHEEYRNNIDNIIYIVYSGGDDLLAIGPWSEMPHLALNLNNNFKKYTCNNLNITLSSGIFLCRPKFPVNRFAELVGEELEKSKGKGRQRITLFGTTACWNGLEVGVDALIEFGEELFEKLNNNEIPTGFVYQLLWLYKKHFLAEGKELNLNYLPPLLYQIERNLKGEVKNEIKSKLITSYPDGIELMKKIPIPASYALLKSRK